MKKVINVCIGGKTFTINEDAYQRLSAYIDRFRQKTQMGYQTKEVIDDLEMRIADLFSESLGTNKEVVDITLVNQIISQLGMPDGSTPDNDFDAESTNRFTQQPYNAPKKFYRDSDNKSIAGVCSGLAIYLNIDTILVRVLFFIALIFGSLGFWVYVIFWIVAPLAKTAAQKCEMRGLPITAENLRRFSNTK